MATLEFTSVGNWYTSFGTGRIARWGDSIVNYKRISGFPNYSTRIEDTGAAAPWAPGSIDITTSIAGEALYARQAHGDANYLYLCAEDQVNLFRIDTSGTKLDLGNRTGSGGHWFNIHGGHPTKVIVGHSQSSGSRLTSYPKPTGGAATDLVVSAASSLFENLEVDPSTGNIFASFNFSTSSTRGVRCYSDIGDLLWDEEIPLAPTDGWKAVTGMALTALGLVVYVDDIHQPGGIRENHNWWLFDIDTGVFELLDVTVNGVDWVDWNWNMGSGFSLTGAGMTSLNGKAYAKGGDSGAAVVFSGEEYIPPPPVILPGFVKKATFVNDEALFAGSYTEDGSIDGPALSARFTDLGSIAATIDGVQRRLENESWNRFYVLDNTKIKLIHPCDDDLSVWYPVTFTANENVDMTTSSLGGFFNPLDREVGDLMIAVLGTRGTTTASPTTNGEPPWEMNLGSIVSPFTSPYGFFFNWYKTASLDSTDALAWEWTTTVKATSVIVACHHPNKTLALGGFSDFDSGPFTSSFSTTLVNSGPTPALAALVFVWSEAGTQVNGAELIVRTINTDPSFGLVEAWALQGDGPHNVNIEAISGDIIYFSAEGVIEVQ